MHSPRFQSFRPRQSLLRLCMAFSPSVSTTTSTTAKKSSNASTPLNKPSNPSDFNLGGTSATISSRRPDARRVIRRQKSMAEVEQEEERVGFAGGLVALVEPRPHVGPALGGIEEVLRGRV